jgi:hypothetical protein
VSIPDGAWCTEIPIKRRRNKNPIDPSGCAAEAPPQRRKKPNQPSK